MNDHANNIHQFLSSQGITLDEDIASQFSCLIEQLLIENQKINLTAIQNEQEVLTRHILDSLMPLKYNWENSWSTRM